MILKNKTIMVDSDGLRMGEPMANINSMYDITIIGAGPAGITAAIYAARKKLKVLVLTKNLGGQIALAGNVGNYTGYKFISGYDLVKKFEEHLKSFDIDLKENTEVLSVEKVNDHFEIKTFGHNYNSKTVILATGRKPRPLGITGEKEFRNKGVTYCATCDAPMFNGKDVAVIGGNNQALDAVAQLTKIAKKIYLINKDNKIIGDTLLLEKINMNNVEILKNTYVKEVIGEKFVEGVKVITNKTDERILNVQGIFVEIGLIPVKNPVFGVKLNNNNEIIVNEMCETNITGLFAAGDITSIPGKQVIVAAGQGGVASLSAYKYLLKNKSMEQN